MLFEDCLYFQVEKIARKMSAITREKVASYELTTTTGFQAGLYGRVIQALAMDENVDVILAIFPIHEYFPPPDKQLIEVKRKTGKSVIVYWFAIDALNDEYKKRRKILEQNEIPFFLFPEEAAWAAGGMVSYFRAQKENKAG